MIDKLTSQVGRIHINTPCQRSPDSFPFSGCKDSVDGTLSIVDSVIPMKKTTSNKLLLETILEQDMSRRLANQVLF